MQQIVYLMIRSICGLSFTLCLLPERSLLVPNFFCKQSILHSNIKYFELKIVLVPKHDVDSPNFHKFMVWRSYKYYSIWWRISNNVHYESTCFQHCLQIKSPVFKGKRYWEYCAGTILYSFFRVLSGIVSNTEFNVKGHKQFVYHAKKVNESTYLLLFNLSWLKVFW